MALGDARRPHPLVEAFLADLVHPHRDAIVRLRDVVLAADERLAERIKWNAPSFVLDDVDLVTMRLAPGAKFQLILHRGAKPQQREIAVADPSGLLDWAAPDRAVLDLRDGAHAAAIETDVQALVRAWVRF